MKSRWYERRDYVWLLTADPPLCREGDSLAVLRRCERLRRGEDCACRFDVSDITDDLTDIDARAIADEHLRDRLDSDEVVRFRDAVRQALAEARTGAAAASALEREMAIERVVHLLNRLDRAVAGGAELTDEFSDELEE
jgi:hypothetical protein